MFCIALVLSTAAPPAHAQEANGRAGVNYGAQIIYSTPCRNQNIDQMHLPRANAYGGALYAEKIWESNNAIRGRLVHAATETFIGKDYNWMDNVALFKIKRSYTGAVVDYVRYFDTKFVPNIFVGLGYFKLRQRTWGGWDGGGISKPSSLVGYYGAGWDYSARGLKGAAEFGIRMDALVGQTFEVSLSFGFK
jgi:hypothetical protein